MPTRRRWSTQWPRCTRPPDWKAALEKNGWADAYLSDAEFATYLEEQSNRVEGVLTELGLA